jgi:hypothetical protein
MRIESPSEVKKGERAKLFITKIIRKTGKNVFAVKYQGEVRLK